ncbi:unnamed protein product, partial [Brassica rapa subsp. narinosa]
FTKACSSPKFYNDPIPQAQQSPINLQKTLDLEPSEREILVNCLSHRRLRSDPSCRRRLTP